MGQLTKNDFISCSLECLTLNLNICQSLQNVLRGSISSSQMSDTIHCSVSWCPGCLSRAYFSPRHTSHSLITSSTIVTLVLAAPGLGSEEGGCCTLSTVFFQIHPESRDSCSGKPASQPGHAAAGRQSWILDHDEWMTFLGEQSHSRMITITPSHSVASVWLQSAVNAAYSAAGISNLIYCNVSIVLALVTSSHLLTLHPRARGWIFHIVSWTAAISRGRRSYYNF